MAQHNDLGKYGEDLAKNWIIDRGYTVLHTNWRYAQYEIDIIAKSGNCLHFIEVKTRSPFHFGLPEDSVTKKKIRNLKRAADQYLYLNPGHKWISFDVLAVTFLSDGQEDYFFIEDIH